MKVRSTAIALFLAVFALARPTAAQDAPAPPARSLPTSINVFLDCEFSCDFDYVRTEVPYVNWVRDRTDADVHVLVTNQNTGGGGSEYTLAFLGSRQFAGRSDTLRYVSAVDATSDDTRKGITRTIQLGLVRYVARTESANRLAVTFSNADSNVQKSRVAQRDPWHAWVVSMNASGYLSGQATSKFMFGNESFSANRTTEASKSGVEVDFSYNENDFVALNNAGTDDSTYKHFQRDWQISTSHVKSLTQHWSAGATGSLGSNSYVNEVRAIRALAAIEYDLFPYKESTRRQLRLQYGAGAAHYDYQDTTIYFKIRETVPIHYLSMNYSTTQPWGSSEASITHNALLEKPAIRSTQIQAFANVRLFKGFSVFMGAGYSWIHDQLYLQKGTSTTADVLLQQHQLLTSYRYNTRLGFSYSFGSIFNNVVNPRFGGGTIF